jgi:hypothetical protein
MQKILHEKEKERRCCECPVRNKCSRCPFPPFPEFCKVRRKYPGVSVLVTVLEWLHTYSEDENEVVALRVDETAPLFYRGPLQKGDHPEVRDTVRLISFNGNPFAFSVETMKNYSLDPEQAVILEAFQLNVDEEILISHLCGITEKPREEVLKSISDAVVTFDAFKFLKNEF